METRKNPNRQLLLDDLRGSDCVIFSDTHLLSSKPQDIDLFCTALKQCAATVPKIVLLGDIFDFIFGYGQFHRKMYSQVFSALQEASESGCAVSWFEGNHEFSLQGFTKAGTVEIVKAADQILTFPSLGTKKVLLSHGDEIYASQKYLRYRNFIKSPVFQTFARFLPKSPLDRLALGLSEKSRLQDEYRNFELRSCLLTLARYAAERDCSTIVSGHFHFLHTGSIDASGKDIQVICQPSWQGTTRGFLRLRDGNWSYVRL